MKLRVGNGYDIHRLGQGRPLIIGGVNIPHHLGLVGHSDADVLIHAIIDAMLGALSLGDIGYYFPPSDAKWANADSITLLQEVKGLITTQGWLISNIDAVVVAEKPKLGPHLKAMRDRVSQTLEINLDQVSIKATTNEKMDAVGREEAICSYAVVLLQGND
ncbi:MAG: 2-C-methyl-D-erythritol 2,4-cyclodiphosphate synthase [Cyanobacteria bacterium SW_9_44_58]|nr:MAG: 2-C-methyl-D-erythritol 2,4-cyclodiphosphate synthase [Cyanobacteria bacterium SW_9_44_58]